MTTTKLSKLVSAIAVVLHSATTIDSGERRDGGETLLIGKDISAERALDLLSRGQISNTDEQAKANLDLYAALKAAAADEIAAQASQAALKDAIDNGVITTEQSYIDATKAQLLKNGKDLGGKSVA